MAKLKSYSNVLETNCFLRERAKPSSFERKEIKDVVSVVEEITGDGVTVKDVIQSYHITPDYVTSFSDGADYHIDPLGCLARGNAAKHYGDFTVLQKAAKMDSCEQEEFLVGLAEKVSAQNVAPAAPAAPAASSEEKGVPHVE